VAEPVHEAHGLSTSGDKVIQGIEANAKGRWGTPVDGRVEAQADCAA
jgi:hypothetical protein